MKNKITREEMKQFWEEMLKNNTTQEEQNEFVKIIQDTIFNTIVNTPIVPDIRPINDLDDPK